VAEETQDLRFECVNFQFTHSVLQRLLSEPESVRR
jgi:hypothetical protein